MFLTVKTFLNAGGGRRPFGNFFLFRVSQTKEKHSTCGQCPQVLAGTARKVAKSTRLCSYTGHPSTVLFFIFQDTVLDFSTLFYIALLLYRTTWYTIAQNYPALHSTVYSTLQTMVYFSIQHCTIFVTWLPATDPIPPTTRHTDQAPFRGPILSQFWPFLAKIGRKRPKRPKNGRKSARIWLLEEAQSAWPEGLCGWVVKSQHYTTSIVHYTAHYKTVPVGPTSQNYTVLCHTILHCRIVYYTIPHYYTILYYTIPHYALLCFTTMLVYIILYYSTLYFSTLYYATLRFAIVRFTTLYRTVLHYPTPSLYYTVVKSCICARSDFWCSVDWTPGLLVWQSMV